MNALIRSLLGLSTGIGEASNSPGFSKPSAEKFTADTPLTFDETVAQMNRGYENTQRIIQFMDAKAGAVVALSLAIYTFAGKLVAWAFERTDATALQALPCWSKGAATVLGLAIVSGGFISLTYAFLAVRPNPLPSWGAFSTLFPAHGKNDEARARTYLRTIIGGTNQEFSVSEFERQLIAVGQIVSKKINCLRVAIQWLWFQGFTAVLMGGLIAVSAWSGILVKTDGKAGPDKAATAASAQAPVVPAAPTAP